MKLLWVQSSKIYKCVIRILTVHLIFFFTFSSIVAYSVDSFYGELKFLYYWKNYRGASVFINFMEFWWYCLLILEVHERWRALETLEYEPKKEPKKILKNDSIQVTRL
ncbi:hypothetical protein FO519_004748 [Halicephalobus sp. NKZ332]|nr:hypothetical protein FO519_004748 [Halicephalobus sp. NKZ332]